MVAGVSGGGSEGGGIRDLAGVVSVLVSRAVLVIVTVVVDGAVGMLVLVAVLSDLGVADLADALHAAVVDAALLPGALDAVVDAADGHGRPRQRPALLGELHRGGGVRLGEGRGRPAQHEQQNGPSNRLVSSHVSRPYRTAGNGSSIAAAGGSISSSAAIVGAS